MVFKKSSVWFDKYCSKKLVLLLFYGTVYIAIIDNEVSHFLWGGKIRMGALAIWLQSCVAGIDHQELQLKL